MKKNVAIYVYNEVEILDFAGPFEVFSIANELRNKQLYDLFLISKNQSKLVARNNLKFESDYYFDNHPNLDYLIIPGGPGSRVQEKNAKLLRWLEKSFFNIEHLLTICTGSRILANTNILTNEEITTHWNSIKDLEKKEKLNVFY